MRRNGGRGHIVPPLAVTLRRCAAALRSPRGKRDGRPRQSPRSLSPGADRRRPGDRPRAGARARLHRRRAVDLGQDRQGADAGPLAAREARSPRRAAIADAAALKLRHHNAATARPRRSGRRNRPGGVRRGRAGPGRGARRPGDGGRPGQSRAAVEMRMRTDPITRARNRAEVPLGTALGLKVRERLTGEAPPEAARGGTRPRLRLDRGQGRRRSRRARAGARRPGRLRRARHQAASRPRADRGRGRGRRGPG